MGTCQKQLVDSRSRQTRQPLWRLWSASGSCQCPMCTRSQRTWNSSKGRVSLHNFLRGLEGCVVLSIQLSEIQHDQMFSKSKDVRGNFGVHNFSLLGMEARGINEALEFAFINGGWCKSGGSFGIITSVANKFVEGNWRVGCHCRGGAGWSGSDRSGRSWCGGQWSRSCRDGWRRGGDRMPQVHLIAGEVKASARVTGRRSIKVQTRASQVNLQLLGGGLAATLQSKHDTSTRMWQVVPGPARVQASYIYIYYNIYIYYILWLKETKDLQNPTL